MLEIEKVYEAYFHDVYRYIFSLAKNKQVAEDITAETFLRVISNKDKIRAESSLKSWIISIARNCYFNELRKSKRVELRDDFETLTGSYSFEKELIGREQALIVQE